MPNSASTFSTARVETHFTYISAAHTSPRGRRGARVRGFAEEGLLCAPVLGTSRVSVPAGVPIFLSLAPLA